MLEALPLHITIIVLFILGVSHNNLEPDQLTVVTLVALLFVIAGIAIYPFPTFLPFLVKQIFYGLFLSSSCYLFVVVTHRLGAY